MIPGLSTDTLAQFFTTGLTDEMQKPFLKSGFEVREENWGKSGNDFIQVLNIKILNTLNKEKQYSLIERQIELEQISSEHIKDTVSMKEVYEQFYFRVKKYRKYLEAFEKKYFQLNGYSNSQIEVPTNNTALIVDSLNSTLVPDVSDSPAVLASAPADKDSPADKTAKPKTAKKKGGRPTKKEEEIICFAIIGLFDSPKKNQIINSIKTLGDVVKKINRRLKESEIEIDERRLDGDKIPGRLFRYLWYHHTKIFAWGYREQNIERDKGLIQEYQKKYSKYREYLEK